MSNRDTEKRMWATFRRHLEKVGGDQYHAVRIESWVSRGVPDTHLCWNGNVCWIEMKVATPTGIVRMRPEQIGWIHRHVRSGGTVYVLVRWKKEWMLFAGEVVSPLHELGCLLVPPIAKGIEDILERLNGDA